MSLKPAIRTLPVRNKFPNETLMGIKIDISNFFFHFRLSEMTSKRFRFAFDNIVFEFVRLPMGTRAAPAICHNFLYHILKDFSRTKSTKSPFLDFT